MSQGASKPSHPAGQKRHNNQETSQLAIAPTRMSGFGRHEGGEEEDDNDGSEHGLEWSAEGSDEIDTVVLATERPGMTQESYNDFIRAARRDGC